MTHGKKQDSQPDLFSAFELPSNTPEPVRTGREGGATHAAHRLAEIAVVGPLRGTFTYLAESVWPQLVPGARVLVPFGSRTADGFFIGEISQEKLRASGVNLARLKPIYKVVANKAIADEPASTDVLLTPNLLELARWMAEHYVCPLGQTLASMLPAGVRRGSFGARIRVVVATVPPEELCARAEALAAKKPAQAALLLAIAASAGPLSAVELLQQAESSESALKALAKAGLIEIREQKPGEPDANDPNSDGRSDLPLNGEQQVALDKIEAGLRACAAEQSAGNRSANSKDRAFLLQGVTGSGKTEVYLRALKTALAQGKQAIVLVPEIALTPQTAHRFEQRLGRERIAILHSHVTDGERAEAWRAVRAGQIDVVIGARSALFAPLPRLGIIVIDEEHENAFKQESTPRYHARDVAMALARIANAVLILGSATPCFETLYAAKTGAISHLFLTERVAGRPMPPVEIVDLTRENAEVQRYTYLSRPLLGALEKILSRREQAILFMNRRGFATVVTCLRCGFTEKCEQCDITLTSHRETVANRNPFHHAPPRPLVEKSGSGHAGQGGLHCHYCGFTKPIPDACNGCGAPGLKHWGLGTERVETEVRKAFPSARVARMDSDTMVKRTAYLEALGGFAAGRTDILVGTQMIAKGLDYPNVTLVGVILADTGLHMPDFRSRERTFQLLAQVAGRAGRGPKGGRVIVQTHLPEDPAIKAAAQHDFETFSLKELQERRAFSYPPYTRLGRVLIRGKEIGAVVAAAELASAALRKHAVDGCEVLGPAEAPISKLEGFHRHHILLKARNSEMLSALLSGPASDVISKLKAVTVAIDIDPLSML